METTRRKRIPASECPRNAWYRSGNGDRIKLLARAHKSMGSAPVRGWIPYFYPGNVRSKEILGRYPFKGWVPADYLLLPIVKKAA